DGDLAQRQALEKAHLHDSAVIVIGEALQGIAQQPSLLGRLRLSAGGRSAGCWLRAATVFRFIAAGQRQAHNSLCWFPLLGGSKADGVETEAMHNSADPGAKLD